jgi:hypothetical protein
MIPDRTDRRIVAALQLLGCAIAAVPVLLVAVVILTAVLWRQCHA